MIRRNRAPASGFGILDFEFWILDSGFWSLDLEFGFWILDFGFWISEITCNSAALTCVVGGTMEELTLSKLFHILKSDALT